MTDMARVDQIVVLKTAGVNNNEIAKQLNGSQCF